MEVLKVKTFAKRWYEIKSIEYWVENSLKKMDISFHLPKIEKAKSIF